MIPDVASAAALAGAGLRSSALHGASPVRQAEKSTTSDLLVVLDELLPLAL